MAGAHVLSEKDCQSLPILTNPPTVNRGLYKKDGWIFEENRPDLSRLGNQLGKKSRVFANT